jgi:uncharacterized protein (TIGR02687 family)
VNKYLLKLNDNFQQVVDAATSWNVSSIPQQSEFYERYVDTQLKANKRVVLLISDAMRYEIGAELLELIRREDRYHAELKALFGILPTYTQLGMASLLPHKSLLIKEDASVLVDGISSIGLDNRTKILAKNSSQTVAALRAEDLRAMNNDDSRAFFRDHQLIYIYHNCIDAVGDKRDTESQVLNAVEESLKEIIEIIKKLANANVSNLIITSDHGFLYQHRALHESEFAGVQITGAEILTRNSRFVIGRGLNQTQSVRKFTSPQLGLDGDLEVLIPKSINRLHLQGAGSRYVHGGASLQEIVIPLLHVKKKRESDLELVEVDILRSPSSVITTGQLSVSIYQTQPVSAKVQPRCLRVGIYNLDGELISDAHEILFDRRSENPREREVQLRLLLSQKAQASNDQDVILKLEEKVPHTAYYREYKSVRYILRRSFTNDFDF